MDEKLKNRIKEDIKVLVHKFNHVSFAELKRKVKDFHDENGVDIYLRDNTNIILWNNVSDEGLEAVKEIVQENKDVLVKTTSVLLYLTDGIILKLPLANDMKKKYKKLHWMPFVFSINKKILLTKSFKNGS